MKLYPVSKPSCNCRADKTAETTMQIVQVLPNGQYRRAKRIMHYRAEDEAHFWHWSDRDVVRI